MIFARGLGRRRVRLLVMVNLQQAPLHTRTVRQAKRYEYREAKSMRGVRKEGDVKQAAAKESFLSTVKTSLRGARLRQDLMFCYQATVTRYHHCNSCRRHAVPRGCRSQTAAKRACQAAKFRPCIHSCHRSDILHYKPGSDDPTKSSLP